MRRHAPGVSITSRTLNALDCFEMHRVYSLRSRCPGHPRSASTAEAEQLATTYARCISGFDAASIGASLGLMAGACNCLPVPDEGQCVRGSTEGDRLSLSFYTRAEEGDGSLILQFAQG